MKDKKYLFKNFLKKNPKPTVAAPNLPAFIPKVDCSPKHNALIFGSGKLWGLPGGVHEKKLKDLNVWLTSTWAPSRVYSSNLPSRYITSNEGPAHIILPIDDRKAPSDLPAFKQVVSIILDYLDAGKEVAVSCVGGHGRTGTVLACIYGLRNPDVADPIELIRSIGCHEWVESHEQAKFIFSFINKPYLSKYNPKPQPTTNYPVHNSYYPGYPSERSAWSDHINQTRYRYDYESAWAD